MNTAYVLAGSNIGNRLLFLQEATNVMEEECGNIIARSSVYETAAWGFTAQPAFYNQAFAIRTSLLPAQLMQALLNIEKKMGRERTVKMGPRTIDLDILLIDDLCNTNRLAYCATSSFGATPFCPDCRWQKLRVMRFIPFYKKQSSNYWMNVKIVWR